MSDHLKYKHKYEKYKKKYYNLLHDVNSYSFSKNTEKNLAKNLTNLKKIHITIPSKSLPYKIERKILKHAMIKGDYNKLSQKHEDFLNNKIIKYNKKYNINLTIDIIRSIRSANIKDKIIKSHHTLLNNANTIYNEYKTESMSILDLSKKYDYSPMSIFRAMLKIKGLNKLQIKQILKNPTISNSISKRDYAQLELATKNDYFVTINQSNQLKKATEFEEKIASFLDSHDIKYKTQEELSEQQIKLHGKPINTPDFLIIDNLFINNKQIKWIDAKNFYGANTFMIRKKTKKQIQKYINSFGPGSIIFSLGFSEHLHFANTILLNFMDT